MQTDPTPEPTALPRSDAGLLERDQLITTAELSAYLSIPTSTLRQWSYLGTGPKALRVGRHQRTRGRRCHRVIGAGISERLLGESLKALQ